MKTGRGRVILCIVATLLLMTTMWTPFGEVSFAGETELTQQEPTTYSPPSISAKTPLASITAEPAKTGPVAAPTAGRYVLEDSLTYGTTGWDVRIYVYRTIGGGDVSLQQSSKLFAMGLDDYRIYGTRDYAAPAGWEFKGFTYTLNLEGEADMGNKSQTILGQAHYPFSRLTEPLSSTTPYTPYGSGFNSICLNRLNTFGELAWKPLIYTLYVNYDPTITMVKGTNGYITDEGKKSVPWGTDKSYTATPLNGYEITRISIGGNDQPLPTDPTKAYTFTINNVTSPLYALVEFDLHEHTYSAWTTTREVTCEVAGERQRTCSVCGQVEKELIEAHHDLTAYPRVEPTCTATGNIAYWQCNDCSKYFVRETATQEFTWPSIELPKTTHTYDWSTTLVPTCTTNGLRTGTCSVCQDTKTETITAGHILTAHPQVEPTCTAEGNIAYWQCTRDGCGKYFSDAAGTKEITLASTVLQKLDHTLTVWAVTKEPTCTESGTETRTCTLCTYEESKTIDPLGHSLTEHAAVAPNCFADGNIAYWECQREGCNKYFSDAAGVFEISSANTILSSPGHKLTGVPATSATCTTAGNIAYWQCENEGCGICFNDEMGMEETSLSNTVIPPGGHNMGEWTVDREPTCTEMGTQIRKCDYCEYMEALDIDPLGHDLTIHAALQPTCIKAGNVEYWTCDTCGTYFVEVNANAKIMAGEIISPEGKTLVATTEEKVVLAPLGHSYGDWTVTKKATSEEAGIETRTCATCGGTEERSIPRLTADKDNTNSVVRDVVVTATTGSNNSSATTAKADTDKTVKTGDESGTAVAIAGIFFFLALLAFWYLVERHRKKETR